MKPDLLVLVSLTPACCASGEHYPLVPGALLKYPLESDRLIGAVTSPVLILHGRSDTLIPVDTAEALVTASGGGRNCWRWTAPATTTSRDFAAYRDALPHRPAR